MVHVDGPQGAPPVLLLHGGGGAAWSWAPQHAAWSERRRLYLWEARGHGRAARAEDAGLGAYYVDANEALTFAEEDAQSAVAIAGHSMGGLLAMALAADRPCAVAALVLIDPLYLTGEECRAVQPALRSILRRTFVPVANRVVRSGVSRLISRFAFAHTFADRARMEEAWPQQRRAPSIAYPRIFLELAGGTEGFRLRDFAAEIDAPTLVLEAAHDVREARFPALAGALRARLGDRFEHDAIAGGHYLQLDRPERVTARIDRFLRARVRNERGAETTA